MVDISDFVNSLVSGSLVPESVITERENALGRFPSDYRAFIHRFGAKPLSVPLVGCYNGLKFLEVASLRNHVLTHRVPVVINGKSAEKVDWFDVIPFASIHDCPNKIFSYIRQEPDKGQIIVMSEESRSSEAMVIAPNFTSFIKMGLERIFSGRDAFYWRKKDFEAIRTYNTPIIRGDVFHSTNTVPDQMGSCGSVTYKI